MKMSVIAVKPSSLLFSTPITSTNQTRTASNAAKFTDYVFEILSR
jgi:hypothetical protein